MNYKALKKTDLTHKYKKKGNKKENLALNIFRFLDILLKKTKKAPQKQGASK